jgi:hypothetical protein
MRRLLWRVTLLFAISAVLVSSALAFRSTATAETAVSTTVPFTFMGSNPCFVPMEEFAGTGKLHMVVTSNLSFDSDMAPSHTTLEFMVQFIRVGEGGTFIVGDDFFEHFLAHATVNANGVVTVDDFTDDTRCR